MAGDGVIEFGDWIIKDALQRNPCVKVPEFPDELTCLKLDESDVSVEWRVYVPKGSECPECKEHQGYYLDAETIQRQQEHIAELQAKVAYWVGQYDNALDERDAREALIHSLFSTMNTLRINGHAPTGRQLDHYERRMRELGIEVM